MIVGAHHYSLAVSNLEAAQAFYGGVLGLAEIDRPDFGFPGAWYDAGAVQLHLIVSPEGADVGRPPDKLSPIAPHLAFEIADYEAVESELERRGIERIGLGAKVGQLFVRDPDGNMIELIQPGGQLGRPRPNAS